MSGKKKDEFNPFEDFDILIKTLSEEQFSLEASKNLENKNEIDYFLKRQNEVQRHIVNQLGIDYVKEDLEPKKNQNILMAIKLNELLIKAIEGLKKRQSKNLEKKRNKGQKSIELPKDENSKQMDLFRSFVAPKNDDSVLSNLIHLWDLTPKYYISKRQTAKMIKENNVVKGKETILINGDKIDIEIKPASIEINGKLVPCFPSDDEELIESVLRKIFLIQGIHVVRPADSWVRYSIRMIQKELKKIGKTRSINEIKKSLEIMIQCNLLIKRNGQVIHNAGVLLNQLDKSNQNYTNSPNVLSAVQLPQFLSFCINKIEYRQYNQFLTDSLKTQLGRWLSKKLSIEFTWADHTNSFPITYENIVNDSCLLHGTKYKNIVKIDNAISNMIDVGILSNLHKVSDMRKDIYKNKRIIDIEYKLIPSVSFIRHMKASNKRNKDLSILKN